MRMGVYKGESGGGGTKVRNKRVGVYNNTWRWTEHCKQR